jgi:hypothetical protein
MLGLVALAGGCAHEPAEAICPAIGAGDLVITELRGVQADRGDTWGQWIEIHNATGAPVDLEGVVVDLRRIDGGSRQRMLVRRALAVAPGGYAVVGKWRDADRPDHADYGFGTDFAAAFPTAGGVTVSACGLLVDEVIFADGVPAAGTWSLGLDPPNAAGNDDASAWCADRDPGDDPTMIGLPGTPGAPNRPCPTS